MTLDGFGTGTEGHWGKGGPELSEQRARVFADRDQALVFGANTYRMMHHFAPKDPGAPLNVANKLVISRSLPAPLERRRRRNRRASLEQHVVERCGPHGPTIALRILTAVSAPAGRPLALMIVVKEPQSLAEAAQLTARGPGGWSRRSARPRLAGRARAQARSGRVLAA